MHAVLHVKSCIIIIQCKLQYTLYIQRSVQLLATSFVSFLSGIQWEPQNFSNQWWEFTSYRHFLFGLRVSVWKDAQVYFRKSWDSNHSAQKHSMGTDCPCHLEARSKAVHAASSLQGTNNSTLIWYLYMFTLNTFVCMPVCLCVCICMCVL